MQPVILSDHQISKDRATVARPHRRRLHIAKVVHPGGLQRCPASPQSFHRANVLESPPSSPGQQSESSQCQCITCVPFQVAQRWGSKAKECLTSNNNAHTPETPYKLHEARLVVLRNATDVAGDFLGSENLMSRESYDLDQIPLEPLSTPRHVQGLPAMAQGILAPVGARASAPISVQVWK
jgi:hypothetical protein